MAAALRGDAPGSLIRGSTRRTSRFRLACGHWGARVYVIADDDQYSVRAKCCRAAEFAALYCDVFVGYRRQVIVTDLAKWAHLDRGPAGIVCAGVQRIEVTLSSSTIADLIDSYRRRLFVRTLLSLLPLSDASCSLLSWV